MGARDDFRRLLPVKEFRRLLGVRLLSQAADGVVAVALTAYLFFSPERQTSPAAIAAVTAATLLPFTVVGPFTGVLLDRWSRRDVLVGAFAARAAIAVALAAVLATKTSDGVLFALVVTGFGINRFVLAGLSAALPHTVEPGRLLAANALVPTAGTLAYVAGLALGGAAEAVTGSGAPGGAGLVLAGAALWLVAGLAAMVFARPALGPTGDAGLPPVGRSVQVVLDGLRAAAAHLWDRPVATQGIALVAGQRLVVAVTVMTGVLLYRSSFAATPEPAEQMAGFSVAVLAAGLGFVLAAIVTPWLVDRWSRRTAVTAGLLLGSPALAILALTLTEPAFVAAAFTLGLGGQVVKICADTTVQAEVNDSYRGRVFVLYDMAFNGALVAATALGALALPPSGRAQGVPAALVCALVVLAALNAGARPARTRSAGPVHPR